VPFGAVVLTKVVGVPGSVEPCADRAPKGHPGRRLASRRTGSRAERFRTPGGLRPRRAV
jgi:hypothetical protein